MNSVPADAPPPLEALKAEIRAGFRARYVDVEPDPALVYRACATGDRPTVIQATIFLSAAYGRLGRYAESERWGQLALRMAEDYPDEANALSEPGISTMYNRLGTAASHRRDLVGYHRFATREVMADPGPNVRGFAIGLRNVADAEMLVGNTARAASLHALAQWHPIASPRDSAIQHLFLAELAWASQELDEAARHASEASRLARDNHVAPADTMFLNVEMRLAVERGAVAEARDHWNEIVSIQQESGTVLVPDLIARAELALAEGDLHTTVSYIEQAEAGLDPVYSRRFELQLLLLHARLALANDDCDQAARYLEKADDYEVDHVIKHRMVDTWIQVHRRTGNLDELARMLDLKFDLTMGRVPAAPTDPDDETRADKAVIWAGTVLSQWLTDQYNLVIEMVTHDIRSALSVGQLGLASMDDPTRTAVLLDQTAVTVGGIADALSTLVGLDQGQLPVHRAEVPVGELVDRAVEPVSHLARAKDITLSVDLGDLASFKVHTDIGFFTMAFVNLVQNAVKYTQRTGRVDVSAEADQAANRLDLLVADDGPGLTAEEIDLIFERNTKGSAKPTGNESSLGLGLHLSRRLAGVLGATVSARSDGPGQGSTFVFSFHRAGIKR